MTLLERLQGKEEQDNKSIATKAQESLAPIAQKAMRGLGAVMGSVEGGSPQDLVVDPRAGKFSGNVAGRSLIRSLATMPEAKDLMTNILKSKYGNILVKAGETSDVKRLLTKAPILKEAVNVMLDEDTQRKFANSKRMAVSQMSQSMGSMAQTHQGNVNKDVGYTLAGRALQESRQLNPTATLDVDDVVHDAQRLKILETGASLSEEEKSSVIDAANQAFERGFSKKAVPMVYHRKKGGLMGQRYKAASDELRVRGTSMRQRVTSGAQALEGANQKLQGVLNMKGPDRRSEGARVDIPKFQERYAKTAGADKLASDSENPNVLETLSDEDFEGRGMGKTKVLLRRDLNKDGGTQEVLRKLMYEGDRQEKSSKSGSLLNILRKIKKELYFKEDVLYTTTDT